MIYYSVVTNRLKILHLHLAEETASELQSSTTVTVQTDLSAHDISNMESKHQEMHTSFYKSLKTPAYCCFDVNQFVDDDERVKYYTGLPNFKVLKLLFEFLHKHVPCGKSLEQFQELLLVLAKLRLNLGLQDIAYRCNIHVATVSRILRKWISIMSTRLTPCCIIWPERDDLRKTMPLCFKQSFGSKVAVIIDCFEVFVERPSNLMARAEAVGCPGPTRFLDALEFFFKQVPSKNICDLSRKISDNQLISKKFLTTFLFSHLPKFFTFLISRKFAP